jgi:hypothetical protein
MRKPPQGFAIQLCGELKGSKGGHLDKSTTALHVADTQAAELPKNAPAIAGYRDLPEQGLNPVFTHSAVGDCDLRRSGVRFMNGVSLSLAVGAEIREFRAFASAAMN